MKAMMKRILAFTFAVLLLLQWMPAAGAEEMSNPPEGEEAQLFVGEVESLLPGDEAEAFTGCRYVACRQTTIMSEDGGSLITVPAGAKVTWAENATSTEGRARARVMYRGVTGYAPLSNICPLDACYKTTQAISARLYGQNTYSTVEAGVYLYVQGISTYYYDVKIMSGSKMGQYAQTYDLAYISKVR